MKNLVSFNELASEDTLKKFILTSKRTESAKITIFVDREYRIVDIINKIKIIFPFKINTTLRLVKLAKWACDNGYFVNGKNTCEEGKVFGISKSDIPQGHPLGYV